MKRRPAARAAAVLAVALCALATAAAASAQTPAPAIVLEDGVTAPVFGYTDAIRERVWVESDFDSDNDGVLDLIALDIMRPAATEDGLKVPAIIDPSPYYTTLGRGNESELKADTDGDGLLDRWPLFYDNYFVPRGYAMILLDMVGTANSTGCPRTGGLEDFRSVNMGIDWLQGRRIARDKDGNVVTADWHNGKAGAIGKSYDGTLANGAASTGVDGLTTIVPISAISSWYDYTRSNGILTRSAYLASLANTVTNPARRAYCAAIRTFLTSISDDATGDYNAAWAERDHNKDVANVRTSVFAIHGLQDDNVRTDHFSKWWYGLAANDVPRKVWLNGSGHIDPFDFRRAHWVDTIHRWFDHWLQGVPNGIMAEPRADIEVGASAFESHADWPIPGTETVNAFLRPGPNAGVLGLIPAPGDPTTTTFTNSTGQSETTAMNNPTSVTANRRVYLSQPLTKPLRISGTPIVKLKASANAAAAYFGGILVDYGPKTRITRTGDGISTLPVGQEDCWGLSSPADDPCYRRTQTNTTSPTQWRVSKGILDGRNRNSYAAAEAMVPGEVYDIGFPLLPNDYTFPAGNRIGIVIIGSYTSYSAATLSGSWQVTIDQKGSVIELPIAGGFDAALESGAFFDDVAPTLDLPDDLTVEATGPTTVVEWTVGATDDVDPSPDVECSHESGTAFGLGTVTVTCTATDANGNTASGSFDVTVEDTTAPALDLPDDITREATGPTTPVSWTAGATDAVDPSPAFGCSPASGFAFALGTHTVSCSATDASGNTANGSFTVTIEDTIAPVLSLPDDIVVNATSPHGATVTYAASATDIADPSPNVFCAPASGATFAIGTTTVWCTANDASGNFSAGTFDVHVKGVAEQLDDLLEAVTGVGPGRSLADKVADLQADPTCEGLAAFSNELRAQQGKKLSAAQADALLADAARIAAVLDC